ncbi:hypothetical protein EZ456_13155 [Pedobacter psychrodurus]|uniref:DUF3108 domain-containing protein n=1 Tax=Pedobacter psychrodurus TaxID=2530456 RepID=A0A4R0Q2F2_9SPHI|nr:hypothetical protein [Pedobacter psychrodurus]TCD26533.1 hypothetical protein EZ456_13155 [Pedobacter psychrodurus]
MKAKLIVFLATLLLTSVKTFAGWYNTYNYAGSIGRYPVTLSFQLKEGYFGEAAKKNYNVIGVYKYDKFNNPIRLEGVFNQNTHEIKIYEYGINDKVYATFHLVFSPQKLTGIWNSGKSRLNVALQLVNRLSDLSDEEFDNIEILQFPSLVNYYFIGVYAKKSKSTEAHMRALKIINKENGKIIQTLNFDNIETPTGNLMTIIYDNITTGKDNNFLISNQIGRVGGYLTVGFNRKNKRFILNPEPVAEGVNGNK